MKSNIKFNYMYRDAGNYKTHGYVIFSNPEKLVVGTIELELRKCLIDSEFFEPKKFNIPQLAHVDFSYNSELDHSWNEFVSVEETDESNTDNRTITDFVKNS